MCTRDAWLAEKPMPFSPNVMLSPNATNRVTTSTGLGGTTTVTGIVQLALRCSASVALQLTVVVPTLKLAPLTGVHASVNGVCPPATTGSLYVTGTGLPSADGCVTASGHLSVGASVGGGLGFVGLPHDANAAAVRIDTASPRIRKMGRYVIYTAPILPGNCAERHRLPAISAATASRRPRRSSVYVPPNGIITTFDRCFVITAPLSRRLPAATKMPTVSPMAG